MHLLNPAALGFALIIPLIILMYLLKRRYQEKTVSSTYLWEQVLKDMEVTTPWQRLKKNILLLLQLLAAILLVTALCRPYLPVAGGLEKHVIVVLDCSASMMATDIKPSRFGEGQKQVEEIIDRLGKGDRMTLITMGEQPVLLKSASASKGELRNVLRSARVTAGQANLEAVISLLASLTRESRDGAVYIVSDGRTRSVENDLGLTCPVEFIQVGSLDDNMAITTLATRRESGQVLTLARVQNFSDRELESNIELRADGQLVDIRHIKVAAGGEQEVIWEELPQDAQTIYAVLDRPDILMADNEASAVVEQMNEGQILLVSEGNIFIEKAINLIPGLQVFKTAPQDFDLSMDKYNLYIFDGWVPAVLPQGSMMLLNPPAGNPLLRVNGEIEGLSRLNSLHTDSIMRYVDISDWQVARSKQIECPEWARTLLEYNGSPLLLVGQLSSPVAVMAFDLHESNIPLQTGFPILMHNLVSWLLPGNIGASGSFSADILEINILADTEELYLLEPGGEENKYLPPFPRFIDARVPGIYRITQVCGDKIETSYWAKSLGDYLESDVKPGDLPWKAMEDNTSSTAKRLSKQERWPWFIWLVLLVLVIEWEVYRRGY